MVLAAVPSRRGGWQAARLVPRHCEPRVVPDPERGNLRGGGGGPRAGRGNLAYTHADLPPTPNLIVIASPPPLSL